MNEKILSIIVPSYNMEKYLPKCLGSLVVAPELMEKLEVLVVNDGSKDRTSEIAHDFEAKYPQTFKVIDKPNGHYGSCINAGLKVATGLYVKILDADDSFDTQALSVYLSKIIAFVAVGSQLPDMILNSMVQVDEGDKISSVRKFEIKHEELSKMEDSAVLKSKYIYMHQVAYKLAMLKQLDYHQTEGICYTDNEWVHLPISRVDWFYSINEPVYRYLVGRSGQSVNQSVALRNFDMWITEAKVLINNLDRAAPLSNLHAEFLKQGVLTILNLIYSFILNRDLDDDKKKHLRQFDIELKNNETLYKIVNDFHIISQPYAFNYVREWRRNYSTKTIKFFLFRLHQLVTRVRVRIMRKLTKAVGV